MMEKVREEFIAHGQSWNGEWNMQEDNGLRFPEDIDPDNIHSLFNVYALGDLGTREHQRSLSNLDDYDPDYLGIMTNLERMIFEDCWPGTKVSRHEINVHDGTTNAFKAEILARRIKCDLGTAQKFVEVFRGLQLRSQDVDKLIADGFEGMSFKNPDDLPKIFIRLVNIDHELPELPANPNGEYTDENWTIKYKLGYVDWVKHILGYKLIEQKNEWKWPDPAEDELVNGTPNAFRSIPIGWNSKIEWFSEFRLPDLNNGWVQTLNGCYWRYSDPKERDFFTSWFPKQSNSYQKLFRGISNCNKHSDLSAIGKAMHADPEMEKLTRIQQSILWTKYNIQKSKLEQRTKVFADRLTEMVDKYPVNQRFRISKKLISMGQLIFKYQKEQRLNLSGNQWSQIWKLYKSKKQIGFRPACSDMNI